MYQIVQATADSVAGSGAVGSAAVREVHQLHNAPVRQDNVADGEGADL